jgi:hypothetical protein
MALTCAYHQGVDAVGACVSCGKLVCNECKVNLKGKIYCNHCVEDLLGEKAPITGSSSEPAAATVVESVPEVEPQEVEPTKPALKKSEVAASTKANTSGQGKGAAIPEQIRGWNTGAFLMNWIWGIGNKVWISLLALIPIPLIGFVMAIILGVKGNQWAWEHKKWKSIEGFKKTQRIWMWAGISLLCISLVVGVIGIGIALLYAQGGRIQFG